jgi:hypothetical protein
MGDGGRADDNERVLEAVSRRVVTALGRGNHWQAQWHPSTTSIEVGKGEINKALRILSLGKVEEKAVRKDGHIIVPRVRTWSLRGGRVAVPRRSPDFDALAAFSFAKLDGPLEAILLLYATGDVHRYWPTVELYGLACLRNAFAWEALTDAIQRILCGRAAISKDDRARQLGLRASTYRELTGRAEAMMRRWLAEASSRFLAALG